MNRDNYHSGYGCVSLTLSCSEGDVCSSLPLVARLLIKTDGWIKTIMLIISTVSVQSVHVQSSWIVPFFPVWVSLCNQEINSGSV